MTGQQRVRRCILLHSETASEARGGVMNKGEVNGGKKGGRRSERVRTVAIAAPTRNMTKSTKRPKSSPAKDERRP